ncbi:HlyD family type I secretion periplasmic adaptor subunit [Neorhizobium galegae]|nr:HlyD family type I secretion periplasmic adaptor subunit [Neorhizobium galegae]CDZ28586.1 Type I secretion membrane fusion protein, HlyD family [Neorhizobium galegae bv. officinalis]MCM2496797.1 HlyD family type I secretion periplasmic adaptor subunit [Neorhizobium galegae]MCQ1769191.1 HlyD family type I secretion periplasmic adaptor subunit [Neorhizobium galegae]MCQ1774991.1 HlyD family type I secretion periplasmic adaptor subunit [Neorhizobium galegae]MCQ1775742.1 HlyD family type I secre
MTGQKPFVIEKKPLAIRADLSERQIQRYQPALPDADPSNLESDQFDNRSPLRGLVIAGLATILVSFGGFFAWGFSVELNSATVANGTVIVDSKRKTISHFEGGVMNRLLVQEGDKVVTGQPLVELEDTRARSSLRSLQARRIGLIAKLARLKAEQNDAPQISFPSDFGDAWDVTIDDSVRAETIFFERRRETKVGRIEVQRKTIEEHLELAASYEIQIEAIDRQIGFIREHRASMDSLVKIGAVPRTQVIEIDSRLSDLARQRGELVGNKAQSEKAAAGAQLAMTGIESDFQSTIAGEITTARVDLADVEQQITASKDVLRRLEIRSPQDGIISNILLRTPGSAVTPGQPLLEIIPENEPLLVEMRVNPRDIDSIAVGSHTQVRLTAYNQRSRLPMEGTVTYVAADQSVDEKSNSAFFVARAKLDPASLKANPDVRLYPGMPAEVLIIHASRRAIDYITSPVLESFNRAFRED